MKEKERRLLSLRIGFEILWDSVMNANELACIVHMGKEPDTESRSSDGLLVWDGVRTV